MSENVRFFSDKSDICSKELLNWRAGYRNFAIYLLGKYLGFFDCIWGTSNLTYPEIFFRRYLGKKALRHEGIQVRRGSRRRRGGGKGQGGRVGEGVRGRRGRRREQLN